MAKKETSTVFSMLKFILGKLKNKKVWLFASFILLLIISLLEFKIPQITQHIIDVSIPNKSKSDISFNAGLLLFFALLLSIFSYLSTFIMSRMSQDMIIELREDMYHQLLMQDFSFFEEAKTGDLMTRLSNDVKTLQDLVSPQSLKLISNLITFIVIYGFLFIQDATLTLLITLTFPILYFINVYFSKRIKKAYKNVSQSNAKINNLFQNSLTSILLIKTFVTEDFEKENLHQLNEENKKNYFEAMNYQTIFSPAIDFVNYLDMTIVLVYSSFVIIGGQHSVGSMVAYLAYLKMLQNPIRSFTQMISRFQQSVVSYERIMEIYVSEPKIRNLAEPTIFNNFENRIHFNNVNFHYQNDQDILNNLNFSINKGEMTALVGVSGSGKTTITKLLERLYDVSDGEILIDNTNIKDFSIDSLRQNVGMVTQDIELIDGTIYENILYGATDKTDDNLETAVHAAKLDSFIASLPHGLDTQVGEKGIKLSGGQKQRIAIARILLKNAPILILDEATAALDNEAEKFIQESLDTLLEEKTSLVIAHRLSTIQKADRIIVMEDGVIVEKGTHDELLAAKGRYEELYAIQFT
ncbi:ABC transporter ATP-binding protein [Vagococcus silagei]|uniref:Multidrug resistance ABC transporter ATP-binding and permease protein n=1 Tax=Vagococcus silagei TaxID=2508885 RepID=A0A4S3B6H6_9ENTE|nr:ABC transporter ATP-binding protein [Vagococcus silagei]THB61156.1 ABC transporter ATP-binding protein [Vagococcus silagei]